MDVGAAGWATRVAAIWKGCKAVEPAPCRPWSAPDVGLRNEIVTSVSATRTRTTTTVLRMSALRAFEGYGVGFER